MMALVWLIDILVIGVKILGGRTKVNPVLRYGLWVAVLSVLVAGFAVLGLLLVLLQRYLEGLD
ncbi:hypothetical protein BJY24_004028 [Nocardia transvalensis]|uniref:Uncharacterized protein n=1 Tax=Nocardia transvalensis TaxID=37333 RepID=A0A7W9PFD4_9NOCA|nr:hypothetical protein [Nocardia transvalensis]MBB5915161.1 hypothetical protein [Nocardia transvalensis]